MRWFERRILVFAFATAHLADCLDFDTPAWTHVALVLEVEALCDVPADRFSNLIRKLILVTLTFQHVVCTSISQKLLQRKVLVRVPSFSCQVPERKRAAVFVEQYILAYCQIIIFIVVYEACVDDMILHRLQ